MSYDIRIYKYRRCVAGHYLYKFHMPKELMATYNLKVGDAVTFANMCKPDENVYFDIYPGNVTSENNGVTYAIQNNEIVMLPSKIVELMDLDLIMDARETYFRAVEGALGNVIKCFSLGRNRNDIPGPEFLASKNPALDYVAEEIPVNEEFADLKAEAEKWKKLYLDTKKATDDFAFYLDKYNFEHYQIVPSPPDKLEMPQYINHQTGNIKNSVVYICPQCGAPLVRNKASENAISYCHQCGNKINWIDIWISETSSGEEARSERYDGFDWEDK